MNKQIGITLSEHLKIPRCPHCSIDNPNLAGLFETTTTTDDGTNFRHWRVYACRRCGGVVTAWEHKGQIIHNNVVTYFPGQENLDNSIPQKARNFLKQAIESTFAPSGSVMLCASSVDEMLKQKGYISGSLYSRINLAKDAGLLTADMATWAHQVRLDANDQRHAEMDASALTTSDAMRAIEFTKTLAELLFVLPTKVTRGLQAIVPAVPIVEPIAQQKSMPSHGTGS